MEAKEGKLSRWASKLAEYDFTVHYQSGGKHLHIDFLSRYVDDGFEEDDRQFCFIILLPTEAEIIDSQRLHPTPVSRGFLVRNGIVFYRNGYWIPEDLQNRVIAACHANAPYWHPGVRKTKRIISQAFNWPNLHLAVTAYIKSCLYCQRFRPGMDRFQGTHKFHPEGRAFQKVYMDLWGPVVYQRRPRLMLTIIDHCTKWAEVQEIPDKCARTVSGAFFEVWVARFGPPQVVVTDNDPSFVNDVLDRLCGLLRIKHLRATVGHPQGNAPIESFHRHLRKGLAQFHFHREDSISFSQALGLVMLAYRSTPHLTTGESPLYMGMGVDPNPFCDSLVTPRDCQADRDRKRFISRLRLDMSLRSELREQVARQKLLQQVTKKTFEPGDLVLVPPKPRDTQRFAALLGSSKLAPKWSMPHRVLRVLSPNTALVLDLLTGERRQIHISSVRFVSSPADDIQRQQWEEVLDCEIALLPTSFDPSDLERIRALYFEQIAESDGYRKRLKVASVAELGEGQLLSPDNPAPLDPDLDDTASFGSTSISEMDG
jgi:hypothetical protein